MESTAAKNKNVYPALIAALLGWMFDGFEMGLFPLIGQPALRDLLGAGAPEADTAKWFGAIIAVFLVGAATGGVLFGWLGDKIGRVRAMSLSIVTYAVFTGLCGFATEAWHIAALRFVASLGMGGEWSLGVALVNEVWPGKSRALIAGLIGAAANVGYLLVALLSIGLGGFIGGADAMLRGIGLSDATTANLLANSAWRFLMISGAFPALLIFFIRMFVRESEKWEEEKARGATSHWSNADLLGVGAGCLAALVIIWAWSPAAGGLGAVAATLITVVGLVVVLIGYLHPVRQYLGRAIKAGALREEARGQVLRSMMLGAALAAVALLGTWGSIQWAPRWAGQLLPDTATVKHFAKEKTQMATSLGAVVGTILAALAAGRFGRKPTYAALCVGSFAAALYFYLGHSAFDTSFLFAAFVAGAVTAAFYGFFPLYFPELFPTSVRATGQGFAFNVGRIVAAVGGLQTATLMKAFDGSFARAGAVLAAIYLIGAVVIIWAPETKGRELPE